MLVQNLFLPCMQTNTVWSLLNKMLPAPDSTFSSSLCATPVPNLYRTPLGLSCPCLNTERWLTAAYCSKRKLRQQWMQGVSYLHCARC